MKKPSKFVSLNGAVLRYRADAEVERRTMNNRRSFIKKLGLLFGSVSLIHEALSRPSPEPSANVLKQLVDRPVALGPSSRGYGIERPLNAWQEKYYIALFEPRRCVRVDDEENVHGTCNGYTMGPGMPLARFQPDDQEMPEEFMVTFGKFDDGTPMWEDIMRYPKFKERYPELYEFIAKT